MPSSQCESVSLNGTMEERDGLEESHYSNFSLFADAGQREIRMRFSLSEFLFPLFDLGGTVRLPEIG